MNTDKLREEYITTLEMIRNWQTVILNQKVAIGELEITEHFKIGELTPIDYYHELLVLGYSNSEIREFVLKDMTNYGKG